MKRQLLRILLAVMALSMIVWLMSCGSQQQNTNQSSAPPANAGEQIYSGPCDEAGLRNAMAEILKGKGSKDKQVANQANGYGHPNSLKNIVFDIFPTDNGKFVIVIEGGISDGNNSKPKENLEILEIVVKEIDQLITKDCAFKAVFVSRGTLDELKSGKVRIDEVEGFEWSSCEWPNIACPGGECRPSCDYVVPMNRPANTNSNSNSNSNTNANANANANRP